MRFAYIFLLLNFINISVSFTAELSVAREVQQFETNLITYAKKMLQTLDKDLEVWAAKEPPVIIRKNIVEWRQCIAQMISDESVDAYQMFKFLSELYRDVLTWCEQPHIIHRFGDAQKFLKRFKQKSTRIPSHQEIEHLKHTLEEKSLRINKLIAQIDYTPILSYTKKINNLSRQLYVGTIVKRSWPYLLLFTHYIMVMPAQKIDKDSIWFKLKKIIGGVDYDEPCKKVKEKFTDTGVMSYAKRSLKGIFKFDTEQTLYKISIPTIVAPQIFSDVKELVHFTSEHGPRLVSYVLGLSYTDTYGEKILSAGQRQQVVIQLCKRYCIPSSTLDCSTIVESTEGTSADTIKMIFEEAYRNAHNKGHALTPSEIERSIDKHIRKIRFDSEPSRMVRKNRAAHYAGEVVIYSVLFPENIIDKVTLLSVGMDTICEGKIFARQVIDVLICDNKEEIIKECMLDLAAPIAQEILLGSVSQNLLKEHKQKAFKKAFEIVLEGATPDELPLEIREDKLADAWLLVDECMKKVRYYLQENSEALRALNDALNNELTLDRVQIANLFTSHK